MKTASIIAILALSFSAMAEGTAPTSAADHMEKAAEHTSKAGEHLQKASEHKLHAAKKMKKHVKGAEKSEPVTAPTK